MRLWTLGNLEHRIFPSEDAMNQLENMLNEDGISDIIWGPDLTVTHIPDDENVIVLTEKKAVDLLTDLGYKVTKRKVRKPKNG